MAADNYKRLISNKALTAPRKVIRANTERLLQLREKKGLTARQIARETGYSLRTVEGWFCTDHKTGKPRREITDENLKIVEAL